MKPLILKMRAFGSYGKETIIDFTRSTQNLFLITGDTGAGKTTIFDAIVFALYGQASSTYNKKDGVLLQSHFVALDETPEVEFTFAESAREDAPVYRVRRVPRHLRPMKRRGKSGRDFAEEKGSVELILPDHTAYAEKNVDEKIEEIVGLTREQFMQVAMIAQGEFMELLRAKTDDKKEIFRKLFNTEFYEKMRRILEDRKKEKEKEIAIIKTQCQTELAHVTVSEDFEGYEKLDRSSVELKGGNLSVLGDYLNDLEAFCAYANEKITALTARWEGAAKALDVAKGAYTKAEALMDAFVKFEDAQAELYACEQTAARMEEQEKLVSRLKEAYELKPVYQLYEDAALELRDLETRKQEQMDALPELQEEWNVSLQCYQEVSEQYEAEKRSLHELTQKVTDAIQLFDRKTKAEEEKDKKSREHDALCKRISEQEEVLCGLKEDYANSQNRIETYSDAQGKKAKAEAELAKAAMLEERIHQLEELQKELTSKQTKLSKKQKELIKANAEYQEKTAYYEKQNTLFLSEQAGILARELIEGEPCKVCGSKIHPMPYRLSDERVIPTQKDVEAAKADSMQWNETRQQKSLEAGELKTIIEKMQEQIDVECTQICEQLGIQESAMIGETFEGYKSKAQAEDRSCAEQLELLETEKQRAKELTERIGQQETQLEESQKKLLNAKAELSGAVAALQELENHTEFASKEDAQKAQNEAQAAFKLIHDTYTQKEKNSRLAEKKLEQAKSLIDEYQRTIPKKQEHAKRRSEEYANLLSQKHFAQENEWQNLTEQFSQESLLEMQEQLVHYQKRVQEARIKKETAQSVIKDQERPDLQSLSQNIQQCREQFDNLDSDRSALMRIAEEDEKVLHALRKQLAQREKTIREHAKLDNLYRIVSGTVSKQNKMDLETFVQRYYLRKILVAANRRFERMTAGQFQLLLKDIDDAGKGRNEGLDLMVYSLVTGKKREVRTLSGGESFMAALSLALGMADQIKEGSGAIHLDMMFIDEGFGSLDEHSRGQAIRILKEMAGGDRMIGIISHVTELKQEIDNQLVVTKNESGSSAGWKIS